MSAIFDGFFFLRVIDDYLLLRKKYYFLIQNIETFFTGGVPKFICDGEKNYWDGLNHFAHLPRNFVLYSIWIFFTSLSYSHWTLFAFNLFCHSIRFVLLSCLFSFCLFNSRDLLLDLSHHPLTNLLINLHTR